MSAKPVILRELAVRDVDAAVDYYFAEGSAKAALDFIDTVEKAHAHIGRQPGSGSPRYAHELNLPGLRSWPLRRFPYLIFYFERDELVDVWRMLQAQRDLPAWMSEP